MRHILLFALTLSAVLASAPATMACDEDIMCPVAWVWSDKEGTCVEAPMPTS